MNSDSIIKEKDQKSDMDIEDCSDEEKKLNPVICTSGVESSSVADENRFQRKHFSNRMNSSNIFFCDMPAEDNISSGNAGVDRKELLFPSAGHDTRYAGQKQLERQHFHSLSEDYVKQEKNANQDKQVDSSGTAELTKVEINGVDVTQKHHFHDKMSSDIFFRQLPTEGNVSSGSASVDREELLFPSAGHYTRYADEKHGEKRHFESPPENNTQPESNANQDEQVDSSLASELKKVEIGNPNQNQTQRPHLRDRMSSDIFFRYLPTEGNASSGNAGVDRKELLSPSAGHDTRYADRKQLERQHFHSPSEDSKQIQSSNANQDKQVDSSGTAELTKVETDGADQTQRHHFHDKMRSDIFFRQLPTEGNVSTGSASVDREELLVPSAGHYIRHAYHEEGERRHYNSSEDNNMQLESNTKQDEQVDSSGTAELAEDETDGADDKTQRHHYHDKTSSDIFFRHLPTESNVSTGSASVDREELLFPSAGHYIRHAYHEEGEKRHFNSFSEAAGE